MGYDDQECSVSCPVKCGIDEMPCYGGKDYNGCEHGDFCAPSKGGTQNAIVLLLTKGHI